MIVALVVLCCLGISALFSGIEAGILSINRVRLRHQVKLREKAAIKLNRLLSHPERMLVTVLLVTNFMNICAITLTTRELARWLGISGYFVSFALWMPIYLGIELLPKSLFRRFPYRALAVFSEMLRMANIVFSPLLSVGSTVYNVISRKREHGFKKIFTAREDFKYLISDKNITGTLDATEREMIHNVVDFHGITARDVMTPVAVASCVKNDASVEELLKISRETHLDHLPVASEKGEITGLVSVFEVLLDAKNRNGKVGASVRRIVTVDPMEPAFGVIRKLRAARVNLAVVVRPGVGVTGIVSLETLIRRLIITSS